MPNLVVPAEAGTQMSVNLLSLVRPGLFTLTLRELTRASKPTVRSS